MSARSRGVIFAAALLTGAFGASVGAQGQPAAEAPPAEVSKEAKGAEEKPAEAPKKDSPAVPEIGFERYTLDNGLEVILHRDPSAPLVAVSVWYHVGSGDEVAGRSGFAHLFEHMMFQGSKHVGEDRHFDILRQIGASSINGTTNPDRTNYFEVVPSNRLETALWLESDRMGYMLELLNDKSFENQRDVVRNERRQRYDNVPYGKERFAVAAGLYPEGHPYRYLTIGRHEDLEAATVADVTEFFKQWYVPSNATLTIAGDIDIAQARALVDKWFGTFPKFEAPTQAKPQAPKLDKTHREVIKDDFARLRRVHYTWHSPAMLADGTAELSILAEALGAEGWGRLNKRLVVDEPLAKRLSVYQWGSNGSGTFHIMADLNPDADQARVEQIIAEELERVMKEPLEGAELTRAVNGLEASFIWGLESLLGRAEQLQFFNHYADDPGYTGKYLAHYRSRTPAQIQAAAASVLGAPRVEIITEPGGDKP